MRNPEELIRESVQPKDFIAVSWNLHKGRTPLGFQAWQAMQRWVQSTHADAYFLQEAMARRMPAPVLSSGFGAPLRDPLDDIWHCQATEIARSLELQIALGPNVFKPSWRHGNAILSPHPLDLSGRWDISAHRFEKRGLLVARATFAGHSVTLLCAHARGKTAADALDRARDCERGAGRSARARR
jgi:endonuclease/exonuclease/phosphatase family metal-dependent hydrolase